VATAPSPASSGTSLVVQAGDGAKFPSSGIVQRDRVACVVAADDGER
jgi:hypothetical protein